MRKPSSSSALRRLRPWLVGWCTFQAAVALAGFVTARRRNEGNATSTSIRRVITHNGLELRPTNPDLSRIRLDFSVPENLLGRLKAGQTVNATSAAYPGRTFEGAVTMIDPRVEPTTRTVKLTAEFDNEDEALRPGMFLSVRLEVTTKDDAVVIPEEAIVSEGLRQIVYPVKDGKVERRVIRIGQRQSGRVEVVEGLQPGESIVVLGVQRVRPGAQVIARPVGSGTPAAQPAPAADRQQPSRSSLNLPQAIGSAVAAERP